jgi:hypothetical protein
VDGTAGGIIRHPASEYCNICIKERLMTKIEAATEKAIARYTAGGGNGSHGRVLLADLLARFSVQNLFVPAVREAEKRHSAFCAFRDVLKRDKDRLSKSYDDTDPDSYATRTEYRKHVGAINAMVARIEATILRKASVVDLTDVIIYHPEWDAEEHCEAMSCGLEFVPERVKEERAYWSRMDTYQPQISAMQLAGIGVRIGFTARIWEASPEDQWEPDENDR